MHTNSLRLGLAAALIGLTTACNPEGIISSSPTVGAPTHRASLASTSLQEPPKEPLQTAFSKTFVRHAGRPERHMEALDLSRFEGDFVLTVTNGDGSGGRVRRGSVKVDGVELVSDAGLAGLTTTFRFSFGTAPAELEVTVLGPPGGSLRIDIQGHPRRWRVCPGESFYRSYDTVQDAVTAADPGATIWVCDGVHYAAARVDKPLTIRPEHFGAATLRDTLPWTPGASSGGPAPVFWVNGLRSGTFRVAGFNFVLQQSALVATGMWTRVEMDSLTITSVDSARTFAVRVFPGEGNSQLEFTRSSITGVAMGVFAVGGFVNVSNAAFQRTGEGVTYRAILANGLSAAQGRVENSTFNSCNINGCVRITGRGGVIVSGNTIIKPAGSPPGAGIQVQTTFSPRHVPQLPILIENNEIVGIASATPSDGAGESWVLRRAVQILTNDTLVHASAIAIVGNRISRAGHAIAVNSANGTVVDAHDNIIDDVYTGLRRNSNAQGITGTTVNNSNIYFRRNNVTNVEEPFGVFGEGKGTLDVTCNWWGSASGPVNPAWQGSSSVYTPWAMEPIAGRSDISCP